MNSGWVAATIAAPLGSCLGQFIGWEGSFFVVVPLAARRARDAGLPVIQALQSTAAILAVPKQLYQTKGGVHDILFRIITND